MELGCNVGPGLDGLQRSFDLHSDQPAFVVDRSGRGRLGSFIFGSGSLELDRAGKEEEEEKSGPQIFALVKKLSKLPAGTDFAKTRFACTLVGHRQMRLHHLVGGSTGLGFSLLRFDLHENIKLAKMTHLSFGISAAI